MSKRTLSLTVIALALALGVMIWLQTRKATAQEGAEADEGAAARPVRVGSPRQMQFRDVLTVTGTFEAVNRAVVSARVPGVIEAIHVDEGDAVTAGETQLFQTDAVKLTESVRIAEHQVAVAEASVRERRANLERIAADLHKARLDYERYKRLFEQDGAVSKNAFELQQSRYRQLQATQKHGKTLVELAQQQQRQAEGRLAIARKDRDDALVLAPLTGTVTRRLLEPGERANPGTPVLHVADTGVLEASALLPSTYYARITVGRTEVHLYADEIDLGTHTVSYKSPVVTADLRTFEVKCRIEGPPAGVTAGRVAHLQVTLASRQGLGVPADCVLDRGGGQVVFVVDGAAASQVKVETGLEHDGHIELTAGPLDTSSRVITSGQYFVDDGDAVEVQTGEEAR